MANIWVKEFTGGLDVRRLPESSPGGTLVRAIDCHINRGGEIEQRAAFVPVYTLPPGLTKGLAATPSGLVVFGHQAAPTLPEGVAYQRLQSPGGNALEQVTSVTLFRGALAAVGAFADGQSYVFHDGARITDALGPPYAEGSGTPGVLLTAAQKLHVGAGPNLFFSAVGDPTDMGSGAGAGAGFIVMSTHTEGAEQLTGLARYDQFTAVFSRRVVQIWFLDPDPDLNRQAQVLNNTGAIAPRSVTQFGDGDVFYLDRTGIRSLRARDSSNSAATTDIGSPLDPVLLEVLQSTDEAIVERAVGLIEPRDGRFWLAIGDRIYVFSFFSSSRVSAWTEYRPGFVVDDMLVFNDRVWLRSGDTIYAYGGADGDLQYSDATQAEVWLPYLDADEPTRAKHITAVDAAVRGIWEVRLALDPTDPTASDRIGYLDRTTFGLERIPAEGSSTHLQLRFRSTAAASVSAPATLSTCVLHYRRDDREDG